MQLKKGFYLHIHFLFIINVDQKSVSLPLLRIKRIIIKLAIGNVVLQNENIFPCNRFY